MAFGCHVNRDYIRGGGRPSIVAQIEAAAAEAARDSDFTLRAAAIFVGGPRSREITLTAAEQAELKAYAERTGVRLIAHNVYNAPPWQGDPDAARFVREEAAVCGRSGIAGLVVHLPKLPVASVLKYIGRLTSAESGNTRIYLETPAVTPKETYYETPQKLATLFRQIKAASLPSANFGLCVDTAHLWTCGVDLQSYESADAWLKGLGTVADVIPPDHVMFHLNDSAKARGVGPDAHAALASGQIWRDYAENMQDSGLQAFVDYARRHDSTVILERKPHSLLAGDYRVLKELGAS